MEYNLSTEDGRQEYALAGCRFIAGLQPVEQERYYAALARKTGMSVETLRAQGERAGPTLAGERSAGRPYTDRPRRQQNASPRQRAELFLLRAMLHAPEAAQVVADCDLGDVFFPGRLSQLCARFD